MVVKIVNVKKKNIDSKKYKEELEEMIEDFESEVNQFCGEVDKVNKIETEIITSETGRIRRLMGFLFFE